MAPPEPGRLGRFEASSAGRALLSVLLVAVVAGIVVVNLPDSKLRDTVSEVTEPLINVLGLNQNWNVFRAGAAETEHRARGPGDVR